MAVDHRDARTDKARDREHGDAGAEREGGVRVAQIVEAADRFDAGGDLGGSPVSAAEELTDAGSRSSASTAFACSGTARVLSRVLVFLILPFAYARRT